MIASLVRRSLQCAVTAGCVLLLGVTVAHADRLDKRPVVEDTRLELSLDGPPAETAIAVARALHRLPGLFFAGPAGTNGTVALPSLQSECSVAASGLAVVAGFNDFRGSTSFSGVIRSADGGDTFFDVGQLPTAGGTSAVSGDPVLAVYNPPVGPPVFYYASIFRPATGQTSLCIHRSTDGGATWAGPFEVTSATHPTTTDQIQDKEWMTVDPETGRLFITWTRFKLVAPTIQMSVTYSDDAATGAPPTWSTAAVLGQRSGIDGQGSVVACDPSGPNVYVAWRSTPASGFRQISTSISIDNGLNWPALPTDLSPSFKEVLPAYGFDRFNSFPSLTVNPSGGGVELVYAASVDGTPASDFGDVYYRRSITGGASWSLPVALNAFPGTDRPQIFPTVSASQDGRIDVFWYDQSAGSGLSDLTDLFYTFSNDLGTNWSSPVPLAPAPRPSEMGNNFGAPHQGDYIDAGANGVGVSAAFAWFLDPSATTTAPDCFAFTSAAPTAVAALRVRPGTVTYSDYGCSMNDGLLIAGESADLILPIENFGRTTLTGISATLTALSAGTFVQAGARIYSDLAAGASATSSDVYRVTLDPGYPCGTRALFRLSISCTGAAPTFVEFSIPTGVLTSTTTLLSENFDGVVSPAIPAGWTLNNGCLGAAGCTSNPWVTTVTTPASGPNAAFAADISTSSFPRLFGPSIVVPGGASFVEVAFDAKYDLEQQNAAIAFDAGSWEYQLNGVGGSRFASSDAIEFDQRYNHWTNRSTGAGSNGDRWAWSGSSGGYVPVRIRIPAAGITSMVPRWSLVTDASAGVSGFWVDNVVIRALTYGCATCTSPVAVEPAGTTFRFAISGTNPASGPTRLDYALPARSPVRIDVFNVAGRRVRTLLDRVEDAGSHTASFDLHDGSGRRLAPGLYFLRIIAGAERRTARLVTLR